MVVLNCADLPDGLFDALTERERAAIINVLQRDLDVQKQKDHQVKRLLTEIQRLSRPADQRFIDKCCARCHIAFGLMINSGSPCPKCSAKVCASCRVRSRDGKQTWLCTLCDKTRQYAAITGEWISLNQGTHRCTINRTTLPNRSSALIDTVNAVSESSVSKALLYRLQSASLKATKHSTSNNYLSATNNTVVVKSADSSPTRMRSGAVSPSSCENIAKGSWRHSANIVLCANAFESSRPTTGISRSRSDSNGYAIKINNVPEVKIDPIGDVTTRRRTREKLDHLPVEAPTLVCRSPSAPYRLATNEHSATLLSVGNVRVSVRSNSTENVCSRSSSSEERKIQKEDIRASTNDLLNAATDASSEKYSTTPVSRKKFSVDLGRFRASSRASSATMNDISEHWDDCMSLSNESMVSLGSSVQQSVLRKFSVSSPLSRSRGSISYGRKMKVIPQGEILISLEYVCRNAALEVHIKRCRNLAPVDVKKNRSNPYVKVYLLPDASSAGKRKTRVRHQTVNPVYDEVLKYVGLTKSEVEGRTLSISVCHSDLFGRSEFLGEARIKMSEYPWLPGASYWIPLTEENQGADEAEADIGEFGDAELSLNLIFISQGTSKGSTVGTLQCLVRGARNLFRDRNSNDEGFFIKAYLYPDRRRRTKQKTPVIKHLANPIWNHSFVYENVILEELGDRCLELTVWSHQRGNSNEFLGGIRLNIGTGLCCEEKVDWMDSDEKEAAMWQSMLERPNIWVESTLTLRSTMESLS